MTAVQIAGGEGGAYVATVDGITVPVAGYVAEPGENGKVLVSLIVAADQLSVGIPPARHAETLPDRRNHPPVSTWGNPNTPDPRANVPGWTPPPASADAGRGRTGEHRLVGETTRVLRNLFRARRLA